MNIKDLKEALVSRRKKDWPKGSIDTDDKKMKLAKDLIDLEKQGAPRWTVDQLRKKRPRNEQKTFKQFQNDAKGLTDKQFGKLLDKKGIKRPDVLKKVKESVKRDEYGDPIGGPKISKKKRKKNLSTYEGDDKNV